MNLDLHENAEGKGEMRYMRLFSLMALMVLMSSGCESEGPLANAEADAVAIINMGGDLVGGTIPLSVCPNGQYPNRFPLFTRNGEPATWRSTNEAVFRMEGNEMVAVAQGAAGLIVTVGSKVQQFTVVVHGCPGGPVNPPAVSIDYTPRGGTLTVGQSVQAVPRCFQNNAEIACPPNFVWTWSSSNPASITVSNTGLITCLTTGNAHITLSAPGVQSVSYLFTCGPGSAGPTITGVTITVTPGGPVTQCPTTLTIDVSVQGTGMYNTLGNLTASQGTLTMVAPNRWTWVASSTGSVTFTASAAGDPSKTAQQTVQINCQSFAGNVSGPNLLYAGECPSVGPRAGQFTYRVNNNVTAATWASSNSSVATVNASGVVTAVAPGTVVITATGGGTSASMTVEVRSCPSTQLACQATSLNYSANSYTLAMNNSRTVSVDPIPNWSSSCLVIWETPNRSRIRIEGEEERTVDGITYDVGLTAKITRIAPGDAPVTARLVSVQPDGEWIWINGASDTHTWN